MGLVLVSAPSEEPVGLDEIKLHVREDQDNNNNLLKGLIAAARQYAETKTGRQLVSATWRLSLDSFYDQRYTQYGSFSDIRYGKFNSLNNWAIRVPRPPLQEVGAITYLATGGISTVLDPSQYLVDYDSEPGRICPAYGIPWPVTRSIMAAVQVTYTCGYGNAGTVPDGIKAAIKLMVGHWYENREAVVMGALTQVPLAVDALLSAFWTGEYA